MSKHDRTAMHAETIIFYTISNGNGTEWSPIQSVITLKITQLDVCAVGV